MQSRAINILQQKTVAYEIFNGGEVVYTAGCFQPFDVCEYGGGNKDVIAYVTAFGFDKYNAGLEKYVGSGIKLFKRCVLRSNDKGKTIQPCIEDLSSKENAKQLVKGIKCINGKLFVFLKDSNNSNIGVCVAKVNKNSISLVPSLTQDTFKPWSADLDIESENAMAYGDNKYVIMTRSGIAYIKTGVWERCKTSIFWMLKKCIVSKNIKNSNVLQDIKIVYGNKMFVLTFFLENKTHFYTSQEGIKWEYKKTATGNDDSPTSIVGSQLGLAYVGHTGQLYYGTSVDNLARVEQKDGFSFFSNIFYLDSKFFEGAFVAVAHGTNDILLGTRTKGGIGWFKIKLNIFFNEALVNNEAIDDITCDNGGNVLITGGFNSKWAAWL
jgi:hypothetical protein